MSDSFADLWNSSAPSKPAASPKTLGSKVNTNFPSNNAGHRPQYDAFSMLASSSPAGSSLRATTPSTAQTVQRSAAKSPISTSSGGDAFSSLLSGSLSNASDNAKLSIAERASRAEKQRQETLHKQHQTVRQQSAAWAGLDSLANNSSFTPQASQQSSLQPPDDDWLFGSSQSTAAPALLPTSKLLPNTSASTSDHDDDWGLGDFASLPAEKQRKENAPSQPGSLWELDSFASDSHNAAASSSGPRRKPKVPSRTNSPGNFDFGDREQGLLDEDSQDEDDILGDLARPADSLRSSASPPARPTPPNGKQSRASSPPPHIIGQIVEMGFTPQQARVALAATETGIDVQAALETLLSNGAGSPSPVERPSSNGQDRSRPRPDERFQDDDAGHRPARRDPRTRSRPSRESPTSPPPGQEVNYQQQADKLLAQANVIGLSVFNRANALFNQGKEKVQKAYEERAAASRSTSSLNSRGQTDGRPRWMQEAIDRERDENAHDHGEPSTFRDDEEILPPRPSQRARAKPEPASRPEVKAADLFSDDAPKAYVSPFRRGGASRGGPSASSTPASAPVATPPPRRPSPVALSRRQAIPATPSAISASNRHKASGTEMFKLGRYAEAETAYSTALSQLPDSHLLQIPLLNNRALTRLKNGDTSGTIDDCATVISIIGPSYHPSREAKVAKEEEGASVDLADALVKARKRRAEAYEGKEKWDLARQDWEAIVALDFAGKMRHDAVTGASRCRKMVAAAQASGEGSTSAGPSASTPRVVKPKPTPKRPAPRRGPTPPSEALSRLKQANEAAEAEDQARHEMKDAIDARLGAWKNGKETNLRALIASLDSVLWPELGWQKVGMAELVTPNQVKIRYTKAIAKLHPDKLNVNNTTLEQRMIANGVFGTLNEAWIAFKP